MSKKTEVKIFGHVFEISSNRLTEQELLSLAQSVDDRMKETFNATNLSSALKVAVLTALNFAEEIRSQNSPQSDSSQEWIQRILEISGKINTISDELEEFLHE